MTRKRVGQRMLAQPIVAERAGELLLSSLRSPLAALWWGTAHDLQALGASRDAQVALLRTAQLLMADRRVQRFYTEEQLVCWLEGGLFRLTDRPMFIQCPPGRPLGVTAPGATSWSADRLREEFPRAVGVVAARLRTRPGKRKRWIDSLAKELMVSSATILRYMDDHPEFRRCLVEAGGPRGAGLVQVEMGPSRG